jgi:hypothetical protein
MLGCMQVLPYMTGVSNVHREEVRINGVNHLKWVLIQVSIGKAMKVSLPSVCILDSEPSSDLRNLVSTLRIHLSKERPMLAPLLKTLHRLAHTLTSSHSSRSTISHLVNTGQRLRGRL